MLSGSFSDFKYRLLIDLRSRAWSAFLIHLFDSRTNAHYCTFLIEQGFKDFLRILAYSMRHTIAETLV